MFNPNMPSQFVRLHHQEILDRAAGKQVDGPITTWLEQVATSIVTIPGKLVHAAKSAHSARNNTATNSALPIQGTVVSNGG